MADVAQITTVTQLYTIAVFDGAEGTLQMVKTAVNDSLRSRLEEAMQLYKCQIIWVLSEPKFSREEGRYDFVFVLSITGTLLQILACRSALLRANMSQAAVTIKAARNIILNQAGEMRSVVKRKLDELMKSSRTHITCVGQTLDQQQQQQQQPQQPPQHQPHTSLGSAMAPISSSDEAMRPLVMDVEIVGQWEAVERAQVRCMLLLDELFGLATASIDLDPKLHPIVAGQQRAYLTLIMRETLTSIYLPHPLVTQPLRPGSTEPAVEGDTYPSTIFITGSPDGVARARDLLLTAIEAKARLLSKHVPCIPRKIDWLFMNRKQQIRKIINENGTYIAFPPLGSNSNTLTFFGETPAYLERAIRALALLLQTLETPQKTLQYLVDLQPHLLHVSRNSGAEIVFQRQLIEIYGLEFQVKQAYQEIVNLDMVKPFVRDTKFEVELALEHRDFINGKKNGKINKIIKTASCRIVFQDNYNDYNMLIDIYSSIPGRALMGLQMLEEELPAEISFFIPETYHKRIIGVGGKNIQKIMKKYGVYVKFSSAEEYMALGGYYEMADNVIARTPAKNAQNLRDLKYTIVESINALDLLELKIAVDVPRQLHSLFAGYQGRVILDIEVNLKVRITFPDCESGSDTIIVEGPEQQLEVARLKIQSSLPSIFDFDIPASLAAQQALSSRDFLSIVQQLRDDYNIHVNVYSTLSEPDTEFTIYLIHPASLSAQIIEETRQTIVSFLTKNQVCVNQSSPVLIVSRVKAFADLFAQYQAKLLKLHVKFTAAVR
eukprot:jgi/Hompol1/5540/HPOL_004529-RA